MVRETRHLWVGNLPENINEDRIREHFKRYGPVQSVKFLSGGVSDEGVCAAVAFVDICSAAKAHKADHRIEERLLKTTYYEPSVTSINATHYPSSGSGIHRDSSHYTPTPTQPNSHLPHGARSPRFSTGLNEDHNSYERSSHFYESRRDESIGYNGLGGSTLSASSGIAGVPGGMRRTYPVDRDSDFSNNGRGRVRAYPPRGHFLTNGRAEPGEYRWNNSGQYRYHSEAYTEEKMRRSQGSSPPPITRSAIRGSRQTIPSSKRRLPTSRSGTESPSSSRSSRSSCSSSSSSSSSRSSSSRSGSLGHSSRSNSRSPRRVGNPSQALSVPILSSPSEKRACAICVKNLPPWSSDNSLKDGLFHDYKKHGKVTLVRIFGSGSERYAIVCFKKSEDTEKALDASQDKQFFGVKIQVSPHEGLELDENEFRTAYDVELDEYHPKATRTLFIGGLDKEITVSELRTHFEPFGEIIEIDIKKQNSSTFAFCQYSDIRSVVLAVKKMDGEHLGCNRIKLGFGKSMPNRCIWVGGISDTLTDTVLCEHFSRFGTITHRNINREKGHALIAYESERHASLAVTEMRGCVLSGKKLQIDFASRECQEAFFDNLKKQEYLSPSESRSWERRDVEKFERQRRGDGTFIARQISTQRVPSFTSTRSRSRYDSFEEFTTGRNFDEFADDSFERDLHEYAGRQRFENGTGPPTTIGVTAATTTTATTTTTTTTTSTIKHRGFSPIRKREERSPHSPRSLVREPESLSPLIRPFEDHESRKTVRNRSTSDHESFHSQSPPPNKLTSPRGRTSSSRMPSHSPSTPHATSPSREITLMDDRNLVDPRRRRPSEYKDLVVRVSDLRRPSESPIRLRGAQRIPSDMDIEDSDLYSSKSDLHDPRLLRRDDPISSGDERSLDGERPLKKSKYSESSAGLFDKTHSIKRSVDNYDYRPRDQSPSFRKPFESRKNLDKFKKDTNRSNLSDDHIRSPPTDPRQRKTSQSGGSDVDETTSWRSRESYVPVTCDTEFLSDASPPGTPVRDEREDPPSDPVNRRPPLNHSYFPHREKVHCSPLSLPLPKFAQQFRIHLSPRGASSSPRAAAMLRSPTFNNTTSSFNTISLDVNQSIEEADPILADTPVSPGPAVHDTPSDSEESATVSPTNTAVDLYERIRALDEKYEKWTGNSRTVGKVSVTPRPNTVHEIVSKVSVSRKKRIMNIDELRSQEPSAIVKSLLSKRSVFDEDSERLENVSDKYEPKPFTSVSKPKVGGNLSSTISYSLQTTTATTTTHLSTVSISTVLPVPSATPLSSLPGSRVTRSSNSPTSVSGPLVIKSNISSVQNPIISSFTTSTSSLSKSIEGSVTSTLSGNLAHIPSPVVTCHNATSSLPCSVNSDVPFSSDTLRNLILNTPNISKNIDERETAFESVITVSLDTRPTGTDPVVQSSESKLITTNSVNLPNSFTILPHLLSPTTNIPLSATNTVSNIQSISSITATDTTTLTAQHDLSLKVKCDKILHKDFSNATLHLVNCENSILSVKQPTPNVEQICKELMLDSKLKINNHNNLKKIKTFQSKVKSESSNNYIQHVEKKASVPQNIHKRRLSSTNDTSIIEKRRSSRDALSSEKIVEPDTKKFKLDLEEKENKSHYRKGGISENMLEKNEIVKINSTETLKVNKSEAIYENSSAFNRELKSESVKENKPESIKESKSESRPINENTSETMKSVKESKVDCIKENKSESVKENHSLSIKENKSDSNREHKSESNKEHKSEANGEHKSESNNEHKSESNKEHKPECNKERKSESARGKETESFKDNKSVSCKENKSDTGQETIHKFMKENKSENKFEISNESRFETRKEKPEISKENKYAISKDNKSEIRKENKLEIRKENKSEIRKEKSEICKEINFEIDITGAENKLDIKKDNKFDSFNEIGMTKESSKLHAFKENKSDFCKENKYAPSKDNKSEMCKDNKYESSKEFKFVTNKENKSVTNKENKYDSKLRDKSDIRITKESKHEVGKESSKESKHDINKENKDSVHKSERKGKVRYNKKEDEVIDEKGVNVLNVESVLAESRLKKNIEEKQESLERLTGRLSSRVEIKEEKKEKDKRKDKYDDKCTDKFSQKAIQYEKIIKSGDLSADKKLDLKKELKEEMTEEHGDDKRSEDKIKKDDKEKCKSDYDRKRHSDGSKNRMERKERNRIRKEKVRERDKHRSSFSHSDKDLEREKKDKSRSEKSKDKARYKAINADDRIRHHSGKHQERKELKEASSVLNSPTEICSPNNYFDRPIKKNHSKQSKSNSQSSIEHDDDFDVLGNSPNFSKPQQHVSSRFKELSEKSDSEFMHDKSARDTLCKKLCSGKSDKSSDDNKSKSHSSLKPHYQKTKTLPEEDEIGYKVESDEVSTDDELKIKNHPQPAKRTKQRATSSSSSSRRGRPSKNKSILDTESDSVDSDSNSETEKPKKPSYFDVTIYDGNMYDKVKARRVQSTQKQDDDAKQLEIKQKLVQHRSRRSKKALQSPSNVIASETEDSDHDVSKKRGKARINSSSEDESFSKIRPNHLSSEESDSHFHSNKQDKLKKKLTSMDKLKSSKLLPLSDITTDEDTMGLQNARNASGTESDSDPRHESKESRKIESDSEASETGIPKPPRPALSVGRGRAKERELKVNRLLVKSSHMKSNIVSEGLEYSLSSEEVRHFKPKSKSGSFELANKIYPADEDKCTEIMPRDKGRKGGRMKAIFGLMSDDSDSNASPSVSLSTSELLSATTYRKGSSSSGTSFEPINMTPPSQVRTHSGTFESDIDDDFRLSTIDIPHQKLTPNLDSIETPNISKELNCDLKNMKEMLHDMPTVKDTLMGSSWRESAVKEAVCEASRGASDSGKGSSSGVSTASSSSGSSAEELLLLESNASLTFREEPEVSVEKSTNKAYHFNREIDCKETIAPRKDKKKKKKHKDKDGHRLHRHSKESHQNKSHLMEESTCHIYKFNSNIESTSVKQDVVVRTPIIEDEQSHSRSSRDSIEDLPDNFIEVIKDSSPLDMPIIKSDEFEEASTVTSNSAATKEKMADIVTIKSFLPEESNGSVKNNADEKSVEIFEEVVGSMSLTDPAAKNTAETVESTTPKPSRSTISQEETLNAVAGLLACYNDYQEDSSPPQPEDEPVIQSEPEPSAPMEDPSDQSEEAQKAAQMLQSEMPEEDRENDREQSWEPVPNLNSSHVESVPIQPIAEKVMREPERTPIVELSPKKLLHNQTNVPELKDSTIHFPDSPSSVQSEPELQIDEDEQTDLRDAACLNDNVSKSLKTLSRSAETLVSLKDETALQLDHTHNILSNQALTPQSLSPTLPSSCDGKIDDDCDKEKETDQPENCNEINDYKKDDISEKVLALSQSEDQNTFENSQVDKFEATVLSQTESKSEVDNNFIFHNQEIQNPIDCVDITSHNFKSETDKKEVVILNETERVEKLVTCETKSEKLLTCEIKTESFETSNVKIDKINVGTVNVEINEKTLDPVNVITQVEICGKENMKVECADEIKKESYESLAECMSKGNENASSEAAVCKIKTNDAELFNQKSLSEGLLNSLDNSKDSKDNLQIELTEEVKVSPPQRGRGRGRGRRGVGRSLETTSLSPEAPMLTRSCITTRHSKTRGKGHIPLLERDNVEEKVPDQPRRSTRTKRARKHPDMVDHEETTNRRKRGGKGGRGGDDMSMRSALLRSDVYDFHDSDDEVGVSISKKGKKQTTPSCSPVKLTDENTEAVIDSNASPRKSRRLREKLTDDESASILSDGDIEGDVSSGANKSRVRGRKQDEEEMASPRKSPRNRSKAGENELDNEREPLLKAETLLSEVVLLQKVEPSVSTHATSIPAVTVTPKAVIITCPPNKPIGISTLVPSSSQSAVSLTSVPAIYSNVSSHPVKLSIVQSAMRGVSKGTPVTCVVTSQVPTTQANPKVSLLTVASLPVSGRENFVAQPNVISSPIKAVLPIKALSTSAFKAFPNGKKPDSTSTPLVDPVTGHLTPMKMLDEGHYIPIAGEHLLSSRISADGRDKISIASHPPAKVLRAVLPSSITVTSISNSNSNPITVVSIPSNSASPLSSANRHITVAGLPKGVAVATLPRGSEVSVELVSRTRPSVIPFTSANVQMTSVKGITNFISKPQPTSHHPSHTSVNTIISSHVTATQPCSTGIVAVTTPSKMLTSNSVINNVIGSSRGAVLGVSLTHVKGPIVAKLHSMSTSNAKLVNTTQVIPTTGVILNSSSLPSTSGPTITLQRANIVPGEYSSQLPASTTVQQTQPSIICANPASRVPTANIPKSLEIRQQGSLQLPVPREERSSPHPYVEDQRPARQEYVALGPHRFADPRFRDMPVEVTRHSNSASGTRQLENDTIPHLASRQQYDLHAGNTQIRQGARSSTSGVPLSHVQSQMTGKGGIAHFFPARDIGEIHKKAGTPQPLPHQSPHGPSGVGVERYLTSPPLHTPPSAHTPPPAHHHNTQRDGIPINPIVYHRVPYIVADPRTVPVYGDKISPMSQMPMDLKIIEKSLTGTEKSVEEKEHRPASGPKQLDIGSARPPTVITPHNAVSPHHLPSPHYERSTDSPQVTMMYTRRYPHFDPNLYPNRTGTPGMEHDNLPRSPVHMPFTPMQPTESHHQQRIPIPGPPQYACQVPPPPPHQGENYILQEYPIMWDGTLGLKNDQALVKMHFISGSIDVARGALSSRPEGPSSLIKISQRMRLEQSQLEGVARKMQMEDEHCILMALPFGRTPYDLIQQQANLNIGFIKYLGEKRAAGIVNVFGPGSHQSAYVIHIFPPCDFADESLSRIAPELLHGIGNTSRLLVVIATC